MTGSMFCFCPHCGSDLRGGTIPGSEGTPCRHGCDADEHRSRLIVWQRFLVTTPGDEATFECPDCGKRWER